MAIDYKGKIFYSMSQAKFNELRATNGGKLPAQYANSYIMTDAEDVNFSQLRTKLLWNNINPLAEFASQQVTLTDSSYDYLLFIFATNDANTQYFSYVTKKGKGVYCSWTYTNTSNTREVNYVNDTTYSFGNATANGSTANYRCIPIQIIGLYKSPAMIYTGAELHEGNGISIENGVISEKSKLIFDGSFSITEGATLTLDLPIPEYAKVLVFVLAEDNTSRNIPMVIDLSKTKASYWSGHTQSNNGNTFIKSCDCTRSGNTFTFSGLKESTNFGSRNSVTNLYTQIRKAVVLW
jgi:hypothetical protein